MENMQTQELISALADGQLQGEAFTHGVEVAESDASAREAWHTYHLIGDVLRSGEFTIGTKPAEFLNHLQSRLQQEQAARAEHERLPDSTARPVVMHAARHPAANDSGFRWKLVAGCASLAAMGAIGWSATGGLGYRTEPGQLAQTQAGARLAPNERSVMIRDARLDELLAAHRQLDGTSALPVPAGFLRNAAFEGPIH